MCLILLLVGCFDAEGFAERFAKQDCERLAECDFEGYRSLWDSEEQCLAELRASVDEHSLCMDEHCAFDAGGAHACMQSIRQSECEEIASGAAFDACEAVWVDCDGGESECYADPP